MKVAEHNTLDELRWAVRESEDADERDRVRMVLHAREGETSVAIAERLGWTDRAVRKWIRRWRRDVNQTFFVRSGRFANVSA